MSIFKSWHERFSWRTPHISHHTLKSSSLKVIYFHQFRRILISQVPEKQTKTLVSGILMLSVTENNDRFNKMLSYREIRFLFLLTF